MSNTIHLPAIFGGPTVAGQDGTDPAYRLFELMRDHPDQKRVGMVWDNKLAGAARLKCSAQADEGWHGHVSPGGVWPNKWVRRYALYRLPGKLREVRPCFAMNDAPHGCLAYAKSPTDFRLGDAFNPQFSYLADIVVRQFCTWVSFARIPAVAVSLLGKHVMHVVFCTTQKEVIWVTASWVIAMMADHHALWNRPQVNFIRNAMSTNVSPFGSPDFHLPIPGKTSGSLPFPAIIWCAFGAGQPKLFFDRFVFWYACSMSSNKASGLSFDMPCCPVSLFGEGRRLSAAAHAQAAGIWSLFVLKFTVLMAFYVLAGFAFRALSPATVCFNRIGFLSTSAMTITVGDIVRGIMGLHQKFAFLVSCLGTVPAVAGALFIGFLPEYFSTNGRENQSFIRAARTINGA